MKASTKENLKNTFNESLLILVYEFLGTFMISTLFVNYGKSSMRIMQLLSFAPDPSP